jgi:3-dehydroquinate synthase
MVGRGSLKAFGEWLSDFPYGRIAVLADENTSLCCFPILQPYLPAGSVLISIQAGEQHKQLSICEMIWQQLNAHGFQRKDLLICLGGGVVTDIGAFVASTYLRGIPFVQVPTSLLAMVDAGIGGKTGVDLQHHKNRVGTFAFPVCTVCDPVFLQTLPVREWKEGSAEMYKHAIIADAVLWSILKEHPVHPELSDEMLERAVNVKLNIVHLDPLEKGLRKVLNFGHTIGHAYESFRLSAGDPVSHGFAVALGMQVEARLARRSGCLEEEPYSEIIDTLRQVFGAADLSGILYSELMHWMRFDKKNSDARISFSLPVDIGNCVWDSYADPEILRETLLSFNALEG